MGCIESGLLFEKLPFLLMAVVGIKSKTIPCEKSENPRKRTKHAQITNVCTTCHITKTCRQPIPEKFVNGRKWSGNRIFSLESNCYSTLNVGFRNIHPFSVGNLCVCFRKKPLNFQQCSFSKAPSTQRILIEVTFVSHSNFFGIV